MFLASKSMAIRARTLRKSVERAEWETAQGQSSVSGIDVREVATRDRLQAVHSAYRR